ncbi:serine/threonine protein kinase [Fischerella sp. PCC 9605]|uniref:serine/threonine protein kinase n=1 Tax=Fischerella sp. PCC 9605 TaxID=1173024 RepID=UPI00047CD4B6|nr:serine/threonine-protein kinase [Fischerella sp. PCC 9605]
MLQIEQVLRDRYQLIEKLGESAGRQTWLAWDLSTQEQVVVKMLIFSDQMQWENVRLFEREAQILKKLNHPRIPQYRNYFCFEDRVIQFALVQTYIPGSSLRELLAKGRVFTPAEIRKIAAEILKILIYLHSLSPVVLHRDIKPSNILLGKDSQIYLLDFGAVQDRAAREGATFTVVGTYGYAPLEQFGGRATPASDLYALGATLIHLLTGISPANLPQQNSRLQFAHLLKLNPGFVRWLEQLTEPNLERRFSSAKEALKVLKANQAGMSRLIRPQPADSQIHLQKSSGHLQIQIPVLWQKTLVDPKNLAAMVGLLIWSYLVIGAFGFSTIQGWIWLIASLLLAAWFLLPNFVETNIYFDHQEFEIESKLMGLCLRTQRGNVLEIDKVFSGETGGYGNNKVPEVTLAVGVREYSFGKLKPPLSKQECRWLAAEIRHWLGIG